MKTLVVSLCLALGPAAALAQEPAPEPADEPVPDNTEDDPSAPDALTIRKPEEPVVEEVKVSRRRWFTKQDYPIEHIQRPLTLVEGQAELALDVPFSAVGDVKAFTQIIHASYGVTRALEVGVSYGVGLEMIDPVSEFEAGKAFSLDVGYTIVPGWVAVTASLPFHADPFAMGLLLGVPFRVTLNDKWALFGGQDLLLVKIHEFPVEVDNPAANVAQVRGLAVNVDPPEGHIHLSGGALYQHRPDLSFFLTMGFILPDFEARDVPVPIFLGTTWSKHSRFDLGARVGLNRPDDPEKSFEVAVFTAYRI